MATSGSPSSSATGSAASRPAGVVTEFSTGITPGSEPDEIAAGPDGGLWFTEFTGDRVGRLDATLTATGAAVHASVATPVTAPVRSVTDANGTALPSKFTATINRGDATNSTGVVTQHASKTFHVEVSHTYAQRGVGNPDRRHDRGQGRQHDVGRQFHRRDPSDAAAKPMTRTEGLTVSAGTHVDIALETGWSDAVGDLGNIIHRTAGDTIWKVPTSRSMR
jgi:hypothetical protein